MSKTSITEIGGTNTPFPFAGSCIKTLVLPEGLTTLGQNALSDGGQHQGEGTYGSATEGIESIVVPSGVKTIQFNAFQQLHGLKALYVPSTLGSWGSQQLMGRSNNQVSSQTEVIVYGENATVIPAAFETEIKNNQQHYGGEEGFSIKNGTVTLPAKVLADINGLGGATASDLTKVIEVQAEYTALSDAAKAAPGYTAETWKGAEETIASAVNKIWDEAFSNTSTLTAEQKLSLVNSMISYKQSELDKANAELEKAKEDREALAANYNKALKGWTAASESATVLSSQKAKLETELKEAQAKLDEANAKVEEAQTKLDEVQKTSADALAKIEAAQKEAEAQKAKAEAAQKEAEANKAQAEEEKAKVIALQDKLALSGVAGGTKTIKLKNGKTKAKATVKLKLAKSESGAATVCAKAKGTSKKVSVSKGGAITLKKGVKKGTYKAVVTLTCGDQVKTVTYTFKAA